MYPSIRVFFVVAVILTVSGCEGNPAVVTASMNMKTDMKKAAPKKSVTTMRKAKASGSGWILPTY